MFLIRVLMGPEYLVSLYEPDHQGKSGHALQMKPSPFASRYSDVQVSMFKHWPWEMLQLTFFVSVIHTSPTSVMGGARQLAGVNKKRPLADPFCLFLSALIWEYARNFARWEHEFPVIQKSIWFWDISCFLEGMTCFQITYLWQVSEIVLAGWWPWQPFAVWKQWSYFTSYLSRCLNWTYTSTVLITVDVYLK